MFLLHQSKRYRKREQRRERRSGMSWWCLADGCEKRQSKEANLATFLRKAKTTADPRVSRVNPVVPSFPCISLPKPMLPPDWPGNHMTRQGPHPPRGRLGAETTSARHRVVVKATPFPNTKWWKGTVTAWERKRERESYNMKRSACPRFPDRSLCVRKTRGDFLMKQSRVSSVRAAVMTGLHISYCKVDFFQFRHLSWRISLHLTNKYNIRSLRCAEIVC